MEIKIDDILGIRPCSDALKNVTDKGLQAFTFFLQKTCEPLIEEVGLMLRDRFRVWRFKNLYDVLSKAEGKVSYQNGEIVMVNPRVGYLIAENASIVEDDELQDMWAGLFASSASSDGKDDSNIIFINILRQITVFQANILKYAFDNSKKVRLDNGLIVGSELCRSIDDIYKLFHLYDLNKIDRELDSLRSLGLIINGICFKDCMADLSLTSFGIHFVNKCQGCKIEDLQLISEQECKEQGLNMPQIASVPKYLILH